MLKTPHFSTKMNSLKEVGAQPCQFPPIPELKKKKRQISSDVIFVRQVTKLIEESTVSKTVKNAIDTDKLLDWLVENSVLSIALEGRKPNTYLLVFRVFPWRLIRNNPTVCVPGNIDQAQYCERIKGIIELLGSKLSLDELSKIWKIQVSSTLSLLSLQNPQHLMAQGMLLCCNKCSVRTKSQ